MDDLDSKVPETTDVEGLYRRYGPFVHRRCLRLLGDAQRARDATQDVFVRVLRHGRSKDWRSPAAYLNRTATHVCLNRLRAERLRTPGPAEPLLAEIAEAEDLEERIGARAVLDWLFDREPPSSRTLAVLHHVDGMTLEEVAEEVGLSVSGVRARLRRLRARLQSLPE